MSPSKKSPATTSEGYRRNAREHLNAARTLSELANDGAIGNPIMAAAVHGIIAYCDALTSKYAGVKNTDDHHAAAETLRKSLGARADKSQLTRLSRLIARKSEIEYDHRQLTMTEARD